MVFSPRRSRSAALPAAGLFQAALLAAFAGAVLAAPASAKEPIVEYREGVMEAIGGHTAALNQIIGGKVPFADDAKPHVQALAALAKMASGIFPPGSDKGETDALPVIWEKPADFAKALTAFQSAVADLAKEADAPPKEMAPAFDTLVKACKNCHDTFRKKS